MTKTAARIIRTPDQRLRVFVSSTLQELAPERAAAREAIERLRFAPVMFELGARPHPPKDLYRAYLDQSHVFIGVYWQKYGWVAPDMDVSGLEDEYNLSGDKPKLIYIKQPAPDRELRLKGLLERIKHDDVSYKYFTTVDELRDSIENDLAMLLSESFEAVNEPRVSTSTLVIPKIAVNRPRHNLPQPPTALVDRQTELAALRQLLPRNDVSLVTLVGPGGTGKSRLAVQVALDMSSVFEDGIYHVALDALHDPEQVAPAIATALDLHESMGGRPLLDLLVDFLKDKHLLLLLDNFEQVIDAAGLVADLLQACARLTLLVTSRVPLRVRGEREFAVQPLDLPPLLSHQHSREEDWEKYAAIQLFVQRARDVRPTFELNADNAAAIAEICRRLDGLPLAIELAAARTRMLTPAALLKRLTVSLDVLGSGARDLPERQQTLHNAITWSYNLLDPVRQRLFRRLAVFVGGWTFEAAEAVCNADGAIAGDMFDHMAMLVDNSLIRRVDATDGEGASGERLANSEPRFSLLLTMRDYALTNLCEGSEEQTLRQKHAEYFLNLVVEADKRLREADQLSWLNRMEVERDNFRAAFEWFIAQPDRLAGALQIATAMGWFWFVRGRWTEGRQWYDEALKRQIATGSIQGRAPALTMAGLLAAYQGDSAGARAYLHESISLNRQADDRRQLAYALAVLGLETQWRDSPAAARPLHAESIDLFRQINERWGLAYVLYLDGMAAFWQGDFATVRTRYEESLSLFRAAGDRWHAAGPLGRLGDLAYREGRYDAARDLYTESLVLYRQHNDQPGIAEAVHTLGNIARAIGQWPEAARYYQDSLGLHQQLGDKHGTAWAQYGLAMIAYHESDYDQAQLRLQTCLTLLSEVGDSGGLPWALQSLGYVKLAQGNWPGARLDFEVSLQLAQPLDHVVTMALCLPGLARVSIGLQQPDRAAQLIGAAEGQRPALTAVGSAADVAEFERALAHAKAQIDLGQWAEALEQGRAMSMKAAVQVAMNNDE